MAGLPLIGELVLSGLESAESGNIVVGAENVASQFKNEIIKGIQFGIGESGAFIAGEKLYETVKDDLGFGKQNPVKKRKKRSINR